MFFVCKLKLSQSNCSTRYLERAVRLHCQVNSSPPSWLAVEAEQSVPVAEAEQERGWALSGRQMPAAPWWLASGTLGWRWRCCRRGGRPRFASGGAAGWPGCLPSSVTPVWRTDKEQTRGAKWKKEVVQRLDGKCYKFKVKMRVDCLDAQCSSSILIYIVMLYISQIWKWAVMLVL